MVLSSEEILIGLVIIVVLVMLIILPSVGLFITSNNFIVGVIIVLVIASIMFLGKSSTVRTSKKMNLILDGQTQNVAKVSSEKSVDGEPVSFEEKIVTTTVTSESRGAN